MNEQNHYQVLGVSRDAPASIIKAAHRAWMKEVHPDTGAHADGAKASAVNEAFRVLSDPGERARFDKKFPSDQAPDARAPQATEEPDLDWGSEEEIFPDAPGAPAGPRTDGADFSQQDPSRLAGYNVFDRERINLGSMEWYTRDYKTAESPVPKPWERLRRRGMRFWAWVCFSILALSFVVPAALSLIFASGVQNKLSNLLIMVVALPLFAYTMGRSRARRRGGMVRYVIFLVLGLGVAAYMYTANDLMWLVPAVWMLVFVATVELFRASSTAAAPSKEQLLPREDIENFSIWGKAGGALNQSTGNFRQGNLDLGVAGEIMTGQLVEPLLKIPGAKILHGLIFPGSTSADVDHAVLCGDRLAIIDSKHWRSGDYYWLGPSLLFAAPNEKPLATQTYFPAAADAYRQHFPKLQVRGWYVFHSNDGGTIRTNNRDAAGNPHLATPEQLLREVGQWLAEGERPTEVDRRTLSRLVYSYGKR